jgi:hypothetical protein
MNAFPIAIPENCDGYEDGMTLRDWFAGQAINGLVTAFYSVEETIAYKDIAPQAYRIADAMLEARGE